MRTYQKVVLCCWSVMSAALFAAAPARAPMIDVNVGDPNVSVKDSPISDILVPNGFDDNDNVQIIAKGVYRDGCWRVYHTDFSVNHDTKEIKINTKSLHMDNQPCEQMIRPFIQVINIGVLDEGQYSVTGTSTETDGPVVLSTKLNIKKSTTVEADDFRYARLNSAYLDLNHITGKQSLNIHGEFDHLYEGCLVLKDTKIFEDPEGVLVVLPITETLHGSVCGTGYKYTFSYTKDLEVPFKGVRNTGTGVLHVRIASGNSINTIITAEP